MKTIKQASIYLVKVEYTPEFKDMKQGFLYYSEKYEVATHLCLCGCKHICSMPIKNGEWSIIEESKGVTIIPSILQRFECKSHYIVNNGIANFV